MVNFSATKIFEFTQKKIFTVRPNIFEKKAFKNTIFFYFSQTVCCVFRPKHTNVETFLQNLKYISYLIETCADSLLYFLSSELTVCAYFKVVVSISPGFPGFILSKLDTNVLWFFLEIFWPGIRKTQLQLELNYKKKL